MPSHAKSTSAAAAIGTAQPQPFVPAITDRQLKRIEKVVKRMVGAKALQAAMRGGEANG